MRLSQLPWSLGVLPAHQPPVPLNWDHAGQGVLGQAGLHADSFPKNLSSALVLSGGYLMSFLGDLTCHPSPSGEEEMNPGLGKW